MTDREIILESRIAELERRNAELANALEDIQYMKCPVCGFSSVHYSGGNWFWTCNQCGNIYDSRLGEWQYSASQSQITKLERRNAELVEALEIIDGTICYNCNLYTGTECGMEERHQPCTARETLQSAIRAGKDV